MKMLIEAAPNASVSAPAQSSVTTTAGVLLSADARNKGVMIQNTGTTVIKLTFDGTSPTQTVYHVALAGCSAADDGTGAAYFDEHCITEVRAISSDVGGTCVATRFRTGSPDWNRAGDMGL